MKKIYVVSLDDDVPLSDNVFNRIKLLCYLVYDEIRGLEYEEYTKILDDNIFYNELLEEKNGNNYIYKFMHDNCELGKYEPFMVNDTSFAFTVNDNKLSEEELRNIIESNKSIAMLYYNFKIASVTYEDDRNHKNRLLAIKKILVNNENKKIKVRSKRFFTLLGASFR